MNDPRSMSAFSDAVIRWQKRHGRHDLPWQNTRDPYAIWVSEIMLQQTQVSAVIGYYARFMRRFPDIASLAGAAQDEVLQHWSGLGYYSRARNLHRAAQILMERHGGSFPQRIEEVMALPGIGRSTAAAICSFAFGQPHPILDGNVKRVFARNFLIEDWPGLPKAEKRMWELAETLMPQAEVSAYIQGLMDLGATICTRGRPHCDACPLRDGCAALAQGKQAVLPVPRPRKVLPERHVIMLLLLRDNEILLEKRPPSGIWGGLWSLPETEPDSDARTVARERYGIEAELLPPLPQLSHTFTHFRLHIAPQPLRIIGKLPQIQQDGSIMLDLENAIDAALPTPVRKLLRRLGRSTSSQPCAGSD